MTRHKLSSRARSALFDAGYGTSDPTITALAAFAAQNPGLDYLNYGEPTSYRSEQRAIAADFRRFRDALGEAHSLGITGAHILAAAPQAFAGRLEFPEPDRIAYCTGQYWPTEYRKAAASVVERAIDMVRAAREPQAFTIRTMADLKAANRANGWHFFDRDTMRFFRCRIESALFSSGAFVTSEQFNDDTPRKYTVRVADLRTGEVSTLGDFQAFSTKEAAREVAKNYPTGGR